MGRSRLALTGRKSSPAGTDPAPSIAWTAEISLAVPPEFAGLDATREACVILATVDELAASGNIDLPLAFPGFLELIENISSGRAEYICQLAEQALRYSYRRDRELVIISTPKLPIRTLNIVTQFSSRFTIVGLVEGPIDEDLARQLSVTYIGPRDDSNTHIFAFSPYANTMTAFSGPDSLGLELQLTMDADPLRMFIGGQTAQNERLVWLSEESSQQLSSNVGRLAPLSTQYEPGVRLAGTASPEENEGITEFASFIYQGRDAIVGDLLQDLRSLTEPSSQTAVVAHNLADRYSRAAKLSARCARFSIEL